MSDPVSSAARQSRRLGFLEQVGWRNGEIEPLPGDASFRRYFRLTRPRGRAMLMDAPPPREDVRPFIMVAGLLHALGYSAPQIFAADPEEGFLLLEDLGDQTYTRLIAAGADEHALYALAIDLLIDLHRRFEPGPELPAYTGDRLLDEAALLTDWFLPAATGQPTPADIRADYLDRWRGLFPLARAVPESLVLRDYHIDNLMLLPGRAGLQACGLLDFQDAVIGPVAYDVVSLLEDARRDVADDLRQDMMKRYVQGMGTLDTTDFETAAAVLGGQRHAKVIGIFTRLDRRDGKASYLRHLPRLWRLLERSCRHPAMAPVAAWLDQHVPPPLRRGLEPVGAGPS